jgi:hypothetical protein
MSTLRYTIQGITDERNECDCCGRTNLKSTVALTDNESSETVYFGVTCAARARGQSAREVNQAVRDAEARAAKTADDLARARHAKWVAHLMKVTNGGRGIADYSGKPDVRAMIEAAGGIAAAKVGFAA